jgi:hypothetical protein
MGAAESTPGPSAFRMTLETPLWTREVDRVLTAAMRETPFLAAVTPRGGATRAELVRAFEAGVPRAPGWTYAPLDPAAASTRAASLDALADAVEAMDPLPLARVYAGRARELAVEALLGAEAGGPGFAARARARFPVEGPASTASRVAAEWIADTEPTPPTDATSDGPEPGSLASRMREEIGRRRLPFRVVVADDLAALAATGHRTVWIAPGRTVSRADVERTVLHEIEGHVLPRVRASALDLGIFAIGTAGGADDQEGLALVLEDRGGFLRGARRRELALRHRAIEAMDAGGTFVEVVRTLIARDGAPIAGAVAAAERAFRGSTGEMPGLGRERVYLARYERVAERLHDRPEDERVIGAGQIAVDAIDAVEGYAS